MDGQELVDRELIRDLLHAYCRGVDRGELAAVAGLFTETADFSTSTGPRGTASGRSAIEARLGVLLATFEATSHHVSNVVFAFDGADAADVETYLFAWHRFHGDRPDGYLWARYVDRVVRDDGQWRFASRILQVVGEHDFPFGWIPYRSS
jgi:hypothetical protein